MPKVAPPLALSHTYCISVLLHLWNFICLLRLHRFLPLIVSSLSVGLLYDQRTLVTNNKVSTLHKFKSWWKWLKIHLDNLDCHFFTFLWCVYCVIYSSLCESSGTREQSVFGMLRAVLDSKAMDNASFFFHEQGSSRLCPRYLVWLATPRRISEASLGSENATWKRQISSVLVVKRSSRSSHRSPPLPLH